MTTSPISIRAKKAVELFERLEEAFQIPGRQQLNGGSATLTTTVDCLGRFKIWAGNIGAFQRFETKSSLDYRIREAPKIATQIVNILDELAESLEDGMYFQDDPLSIFDRKSDNISLSNRLQRERKQN